MESSHPPLGQYQLIEKIAQGGMAEIFRGKALDAHGIEKPVVIKRILPHIAASPEFVKMLIDEAKIAVMLTHGNIAHVYDLGKVADDYFIVMEYVEGKTISQMMKRLQTRGLMMPTPVAVALCIEVANGLDFMHRKTDEFGNPLNIIHRDISPQNLILSNSGTVKIIDFGIAKAKSKISTTDSGVVKGKFAYMSPEHADGESLDQRTDIFSLGIILHELLTGQRLFKGKNNRETVRNVKRGRISPPSELRDGMNAQLDGIVLRALERNREKRYQTAFAFQQDLTRFLVEFYPSFSSKDLVKILKELFPEEEVSEKKKIVNSQKTVKEHLPEEEETKIARTESLRLRLDMIDLYSPPKITPPAPKPLVEAEPTPLPVVALPPEPEEESPLPPVKKKQPLIAWQKKYIYSATAALLIITVGIVIHRLYPKGLPRRHEDPVAITQFVPPPRLVTQQPVTGSIQINSIPPGARLFLDDQETDQVTPTQLTGLAIGTVKKVGLLLGQYRFWEGTITVTNATPTTLNIPLEMNFGGLEIQSIPSGASVSLNGQMIGSTPFRLAQVPPETTYQIQLTLPGYHDWSGGIKIFGGKNEVVSASLKKLR